MSLPYLQPYFGLSNSLQTAQAAGGAGGIGGWVELGRTTLGSAGDTITVSSLADKRYYMVLGNPINNGAVDYDYQYRLNSDTGTNYSRRRSANGGADNAAGNQNMINITSGVVQSPVFSVGYFSNLSTKEKLVQNWLVDPDVAGAGTAPERTVMVGKHAQTTNPIDEISLLNLFGSNKFGIGSEVVVLGWDPADTHTTNFWEELASVDLSGGAATTIDSGTFTAKKYLCFQIFAETVTNIVPRLQFNSDTGANYSRRGSNNGGTDFTSVNGVELGLELGNTADNSFINGFIINNSANEKLMISHTVNGGGAGSANDPDRKEIVGKWANTSAQITKLVINNTGGTGNFGTKSIMKVFGSD